MLNENHFKSLGIPLGDRLRLCLAINKISGKFIFTILKSKLNTNFPSRA